MDLENRRLILDLIAAGIATHRAVGNTGIALMELAAEMKDPSAQEKVHDHAKVIMDSNTELVEKLQSAMSALTKKEG
jgi:hypothetical protein